MTTATKTYDKFRLQQLLDQLLTAQAQIAVLQAEIIALQEAIRTSYDAGYSQGEYEAESAIYAELNR